jgi:hypothetical protein
VTSICAALVPNNDIMFFCQNVDKFAFGFIAPLQTDDAGSGHAGFPSLRELFLSGERNATFIRK